jgi:hypothetical protein
MSPINVLDVVLAIGVIAMVVAPLAWAIRTQQRDVPHPVAAPSPAAPPPDPKPSEPSRRGSKPAYKPLAGRT